MMVDWKSRVVLRLKKGERIGSERCWLVVDKESRVVLNFQCP
jgi:hypothetical protein